GARPRGARPGPAGIRWTVPLTSALEQQLLSLRGHGGRLAGGRRDLGYSSRRGRAGLRRLDDRQVDPAARVPERLALGAHALLGEPPLLGVLLQLLADLHRAELRAAHRAEVRGLGRLGREGLVVVLAGPVRVEREVELVLPAELEPRLRQRVVPGLRRGV